MRKNEVMEEEKILKKKKEILKGDDRKDFERMEREVRM